MKNIFFNKIRTLYIYIYNSAGKVWIVPYHNLKTALALYEPSSLKGKLLQRGLPYIKFLVPFLNPLGIKLQHYAISNDLKHKLQEIFNKNDLEFAFFLGTPGNHQKTTIQIYSGRKILGYCKVTSNAEIFKLFQREVKLLFYLQEKRVINVPKCLFCGEIAESGFIFVQSTCKKNNSLTYHEINKAHISFLKEMQHCTEVRCNYYQSDYYKTISDFRFNIEKFSNIFDVKMINDIIVEIERCLIRVEIYSFYHGDFTPWNTFLSHNKIFAFDFEYAKKTYPPMLDIFHFLVQVKIYEENRSAQEIFNAFKKLFIEGELEYLFPSPVKYFMMYLISILEFYFERDKNNPSEETKKNQRIRYELLVLCFNYIQTLPKD